ncbi:MAG TPA: 50S ribosomal protein L10 [Candidatus Saccharibacteria bacterium]|nr:50S ribosomal protein L10 [Candidatus Saccharibacteria bacterium]
MALTKDKKQAVVDEVAGLLQTSKMTVVAAYQGTTVKALQQLRKEAKADGTVVKVAKNRLVIHAVQSSESLKDTDTSALKGQLIYAFNDTDEVAPAKTLATFAKLNPSIQFVGAISADGSFLSAEEISALATLPSKNQLIAGIINTLQSPVNGVMSGLKGNLHGLLGAIEAKAAN